MKLPIKTTLEDMTKVSEYLANKPTGTTLKEAKGVLGSKLLDGRKLSALKVWNIIQEEGEKYKLTSRGRSYARGNKEERVQVLCNIIDSIPPYKSAVEKAVADNQNSIISVDVGANWVEYFEENAGKSDTTVQAQAICFFHLVAGAGLGEMTVGRRGKPTRIDWNLEEAKKFVSGQINQPNAEEREEKASEKIPGIRGEKEKGPTSLSDVRYQLGQSIFLAHGKNKKVLEQLKAILGQFNIPFKIATEEPNLGRPVSSKVRETMQACNCAILLFTADEEFKDLEGKTIWRPSENVVHELGACSYLYENRIVVIKDDKIQFPANFKDLGYISFKEDNLQEKAMDIVKELIGFGLLKIST